MDQRTQYRGNPSAIEHAFSPDGFFKTGDTGYEDGKGNFYVTDRIKEFIKVKGYQVAPAELEDLLSHPKINDIAVLGVYDANFYKERPCAYVLPVQGVRCDEEWEKEICD